MKRAIFSTIALIVAASTEAHACSIDPSGKEPPRPTQVVIDTVARSLFENAIYIAEVEVLTRPNGPSDPGQLRLLAVIKGKPPERIIVPLPDPCKSDFPTVGERKFVSYTAGDSQPVPVEDDVMASIRRQRLLKELAAGERHH